MFRRLILCLSCKVEGCEPYLKSTEGSTHHAETLEGVRPRNFYFGASRASVGIHAQAQTGKYRLLKTIPVPGDEGWDYVAVDSEARHVFVSHGSHVVVLDADSGAVVGDIPDTQGVHGIAIAADAGRGFTSNGRANTVTIFDLKTFKVLGSAKTGSNPDAIVYEAGTKRVFTMNGRSGDTTAINVADGAVAGTLALGGKPEFAVADGHGNVYVNLEDKSELVHFDAQKMVVLHRWPMAPCEEPSGLAADWKSHRLFAGCDNKLMAVINADTGKVVATVPIGDGVDANGFDPETILPSHPPATATSRSRTRIRLTSIR